MLVKQKKTIPVRLLHLSSAGKAGQLAIRHSALRSASPGTLQRHPPVDTLCSVRGGARLWQGWGDAHTPARGIRARGGGVALRVLVLDTPRRTGYGKTSRGDAGGAMQRGPPVTASGHG